MPKRVEFNTSFSLADTASTGPAVPASLFTSVYEAQEVQVQNIELEKGESQIIDLSLLGHARYLAVKSDDILFQLELDGSDVNYNTVGVGQWWAGVDVETRRIRLTNLGVLIDEGAATSATPTTLTDTTRSWIYTTVDGRNKEADGFIRYLGDLSFVLALDGAPGLLELEVNFNADGMIGNGSSVDDLVTLIQDAINRSPYLGIEDKNITSTGTIRASASRSVVTGSVTSFLSAGVQAGDILVVDHEATISEDGMAQIAANGTVTGTGGTTWSSSGVEVGDILLMAPRPAGVGQRASGSTGHTITGITSDTEIRVAPISNSIGPSSYKIVRRIDVNKKVDFVSDDASLTVTDNFDQSLPSGTPFKIIRRDPNSVRASWVWENDDESSGRGHLRFVSQSPGARNIEIIPNQGDTRSLAILGLDDLTVNLGGEDLDGMRVRIISGMGAGQDQEITSATRTSLTVADWDATAGDPARGSGYRIVKPMKGSVEILLAR